MHMYVWKTKKQSYFKGAVYAYCLLPLPPPGPRPEPDDSFPTLVTGEGDKWTRWSPYSTSLWQSQFMQWKVSASAVAFGSNTFRIAEGGSGKIHCLFKRRTFEAVQLEHKNSVISWYILQFTTNTRSEYCLTVHVVKVSFFFPSFNRF